MEKGKLSNVTRIDDYIVNVHRPMDNAIVVGMAKNLARRAGFSVVDETMIASVASELATNILRYAGTGSVILNIVEDTCNSNRKGVEIIAKDNGPGIDDIEMAFKENFTTTANSLGMGLASVYIYADELKVESNKKDGTCILVRKWR